MTAFASATTLTARLRRRELGSRELLEEYLDRVERLDPGLGAVVTLDTDRARAEAAAADEAAARGEPLGPLHGLPVTVKDSIETASLRTTAGAPELVDHVPDRDATAVARLRAAGAIVFGKTNTPAWAGEAQTYNAVAGTTNNPWDRTRSPGGSSGGPAAAVAAGLTGLDIGSDLGGSIRMPAGYCGVYGLRPSYGLVPTRGHLPPPPGVRSEIDMGVLGPLARGADDLALALDALAGPDEVRGVAWRLALPPPRPVRRAAVWLDDPGCPVDTAVADVLAAAADALRATGVVVDERAGPGGVEGPWRLFQQLVQPAFAAGVDRARYDELVALAASGADTPHVRWARHVTQSARDLMLAQERRLGLMAEWAGFFQEYDVLLCPVTPTTAIPHDHSPDPDARRITVNGRRVPYWHQVRWTQAISAVALPVVTAPVGLARDGLPVGMQIVGPHLEDRTPIAFARRLAGVVGGYQAPPAFDGAILAA